MGSAVNIGKTRIGCLSGFCQPFHNYIATDPHHYDFFR